MIPKPLFHNYHFLSFQFPLRNTSTASSPTEATGIPLDMYQRPGGPRGKTTPTTFELLPRNPHPLKMPRALNSLAHFTSFVGAQNLTDVQVGVVWAQLAEAKQRQP